MICCYYRKTFITSRATFSDEISQRAIFEWPISIRDMVLSLLATDLYQIVQYYLFFSKRKKLVNRNVLPAEPANIFRGVSPDFFLRIILEKDYSFCVALPSLGTPEGCTMFIGSIFRFISAERKFIGSV